MLRNMFSEDFRVIPNRDETAFYTGIMTFDDIDVAQ